MRGKRRDTEVFSLSFLDCICCGFGAIILLLVLSEFGQPLVLEQSRKDLDGQVRKLQAELFEIRGETEVFERRLKGRVDRLTRERLNLARARGDLTDIAGAFSASRTEAEATNIIERELVAAQETLSVELRRLEQQRAKRRVRTQVVSGIPVDSEYVIFIIDTSPSMTNFHWGAAIDSMIEILNIYPRVKGMQVMDDEGKVMFSGSRGRWLTDSADLRRRIVENMRRWTAFSNSSPVEGIEEAIRSYWAADKRISLYVLGDEFTGDSIQQALDEVRRINKPDARGVRRVRIHAIGFPAGTGMTAFTSIRFSALMRSMCEENNGTFVGITTEKPCRLSIEFGGQRRCIG